MAFSKIQIVGNLGRDPELRYTPNGRPVTEFSVAVNQSTKNQQTNEWVEATDWFRVSVWGDRAERAAENLRKGTRVLVDGRFRTREYETKDGRKGLSLEITADTVLSLDRREGAEGTFSGAPGGAPAGGPGPSGPRGGQDDTEIDELPF
ncbi:MAG TPA: single-stranded DNA-binding protein [Candidatus Acidoferrales bacterium]|jgi:single-strand DNA-binding protein|nr:single-stranded DNA-binding protein [Candidatus Acidoferrales bacterium]